MSVTRQEFESFPLKDWYDLLLRKENYSHYIDRPWERLIKDAQGELQELLVGIQNEDKENIVEEAGDVIFNICQVFQALLKRELITPEDLQQSGINQKKKIYKRQPYLKEHKKLATWDEETALFRKLKEQC